MKKRESVVDSNDQTEEGSLNTLKKIRMKSETDGRKMMFKEILEKL